MFDVFESVRSRLTVQPPNIGRGAGSGGFAQLAAIFINILIGVGFAIGIAALAYSMVMYVLSQGNPDNTKKAWNAFVWAVIGTMVSLGIVAIKNIVIVGLIGVTDTNITTVPGF